MPPNRLLPVAATEPIVGTTLDGTFKVIVLFVSAIHVLPFIVCTLIVAVPLVAFGI